MTASAPVFGGMAAAAVLVPKPAEQPEVMALIPAAIEALRARHLNTVEKRDVAHRSLGRIATSDNDFLPRPIGREETLEQALARRKAHNDQVWAERAALEQTARECDLTPERVAKLRTAVARGLPRWVEYRRAVEIITDFEGNYEEPPPPGPVIESIRRAEAERLDDLSDDLSYAMTGEQVALVEALTTRHSPYRRAWEIVRLDGYMSSVLALPVKAPYIRMHFTKLAERCKTQRELRVLVGAYGIEPVVSRVEIEGQRVTKLSLAGLCEITPAI